MKRAIRRPTLVLALCAALAACPAIAMADPAPEREQALARAAEYREAGDWLPALALYEGLHARDPADATVYRLRVLTLADLGAAERAWVLYRQRPGLFADAEAARLQADRIARLATWGDVEPASESQRLDDMRRAQAALQASEAAAPGGALSLRQRFDRIVILNGLDRHHEAAQDYHALRAESVELPAYALAAAGESLLADRQPEAAIEVLERAVAAHPDEMGPRISLAYAYLEAEQAMRARAVLEERRPMEPAWRRHPDARQSEQNWDRYSLDTHLAMIHAYSRDPATAQAALEPMVALAPNNSDLHGKLGVVLLQRGRPTRALERLRVAHTVDPRNREARIAMVDALTVLDRHRQAREIRDELVQRYPDQVQVQRMDRNWRRENGWQGELAANRGRSDGPDDIQTASPLGSREGGYRLSLWSPRLGDRWRVGGYTQERWAEFDGPRVSDRRQGVGVRYAHDRLRLEAGVNRPDHGPLRGTGAWLDGRWRFSDTLRGRAELQRNAQDASLQARQAGVTADRVAVGLDWRPDERGWAGGELAQWRFDDGNRRESASVYAGQWFHVRPRQAWAWEASLQSGRGRLDDAAYFSPTRDASWNAGLNLESTGYRRYERSFMQRAGVNVGQYWQQGFGTAAVPSANYGHTWTFESGRRLDYGLSWSRPVYDGRRESRLALDVRFTWGAR